MFRHIKSAMNTPVAPLFENDEYYQTFMSPFPVATKKRDDDENIDEQQPEFLVRLYLGSLTIVGLYILFRVLD